MSVISCAYPQHRWENYEGTLALWTEMLEDLDARTATLAVKRLIATNKWPPSIADVREAAVKNARQGQLTAGQAWGKITAAIRRYGWYQADEAKEALGQDLWGMVRQIGGWTHLCECDNIDVVGGQFERRYNAMLEVQRDRLQVPASVQKDIKELAARLAQGILMDNTEKKLEG